MLLSIDQVHEKLMEVMHLEDFQKRTSMGPCVTELAELMGVSPSKKAVEILTNPTSVKLPKSVPEKSVTWLPGHHIGCPDLPGPRAQVPIMMVCKAPTLKEMKSGNLLCNDKQSGNFHLYDKLRYVGLDEDYLAGSYITNALRFVPTKKNIPAAWLKECGWFLWAELYMVRPDYLLVMGSEALKILFGNKASVERYRGDFTPITLNYGTGDKPDEHIVKAFVMANPSNMLRDPAQTPDIILDLQVFSNRVRGKTKISKEQPEYTIVETVEQLNALEEKIKDKKLFAVDCEWSGPSPFHDNVRLLTIQLAWDIGKAACIVVSPQDDGGPDNSCDSVAIRDMLIRVLCRRDENGLPEVSVVGHNFRADYQWLKWFGVDLIEQFHQGGDTMLGHHLLRETGGQGLEVCVLEYTDLGRYDIPMAEWIHANLTDDEVEETGYAKVPRDMLYKYALLDADATYRVYLAILEELKVHPEIYALYTEIVMKAAVAITEMESHGIYVDNDRLEILGEAYGAKREALVKRLREEIRWPDFNYRSVNQVREFLFGVDMNGKLDPEDPKKNIRLSPPGAILLNLTPIKTTDKPTKMWSDIVAEGKTREASPSTDAETLGILASEHPSCGLLRDIKFVDQMCKNFVPPKVDLEKKLKGLPKFRCSDNRIRTNIRQTLETGRWASLRPNLQNIPKRQEAAIKKLFGDDYKYPLRTIFTATPGWVLIEADYVQAELFGMAYLANDQNMISVLRDPKRDIHAEMAISMFQLPYGGYARDGPVKEWLENQPNGKAQRVAGKTLSFGEIQYT